MKIRFHKLAKKEYNDSLEYYFKESEYLSIKFKTELKQSFNNIQNFPNLYPFIENLNILRIGLKNEN